MTRSTWPSAAFWVEGPTAAALADHDFGSVFRALSAAGLSQAAMARRFGMSQPEVSAVIRGNREVRWYELIARIVEGLGVPPGYAGVCRCACGGDRAEAGR